MSHLLADGRQMPEIGFGTHPLRDEEGITVILSALEAGYRMLDTAVNYDNEREVGEALRRSGLPREEVFLTSKIPGRHHGYDDAVRSTEESLQRLGVDHLDLHLIHWPNPSVDKYVEAWRALIDLQQRGLVRSIGVSNFTAAHLRRLQQETGVLPVVNQIEMHPYFIQAEQRRVHDELGILTEAWSPLGKDPMPFHEAAVRDAAEAHGVTPGQVVLRWHLQHGTVPIPKSADPERQRQNLDLHGFDLSAAEMAAIDSLDRPDGRRFGGDPDHHEEP